MFKWPLVYKIRSVSRKRFLSKTFCESNISGVIAMAFINIKKIVITLSIAVTTFFVPISFATCIGSTCGPIITCVFGDTNSYNNGHPTECDPKDNGCSQPGIYYRQLNETDCRDRGGVPESELFW